MNPKPFSGLNHFTVAGSAAPPVVGGVAPARQTRAADAAQKDRHRSRAVATHENFSHSSNLVILV
jgi:hypothetical protein